MGLKRSNLYAERIYSEHPLALWSFDDDISFVKLLSDTNSDLDSSWITTNVSGFESPLSLNNLVDNSSNQRAVLSSGIGGSFISEFYSLFSFVSSNFNPSMSTSCFSVQIYNESSSVTKYEIGIEKNSTIEEFSEYTVDDIGWTTISHTFSVPSGADSIKLLIKIYTSATTDVQFAALTLGQWSEKHISTTTGYSSIPMNIELQSLVKNSSQYSCGYIDSYGIDSESVGYFLVKQNKAYVRQSGIPLVFGSQQTVRVEQADDSNPSIIIPSQGMLNESGKYNRYTLEFWARLSNISLDPVRIIGPIDSTDGVYIEEGYISVYVGEYTKSYFLGRFNRPMLVHLEYSEETVVLMINGEIVISIVIDVDNVSFPPQSIGGHSKDYFGVYGNSVIDPFEISCIAIYPYLMPPEMAKKHFVWGQGVLESDFSNDTFAKENITFDFPYSEYAYNVIYPDTMKWRSGFSINMETNSASLGIKKYITPEVIAIVNGEQVSSDAWFRTNRTLNNEYKNLFAYVEMSPYADYDESTIYFKNMQLLSEKIESVYGIFKSPSVAANNQTLINFNNKSTNENIRIYLNGTTLRYSYIDNLGVETILYSETILGEEYFNAGINISKLSAEYFFTIGNFFANRDKVSMNIGNYSGSMFNGQVYGIHFNNKYFFDRDLQTYFTDSFINQGDSFGFLMTYISNYSLLPIFKNITMDFDIGAAGYWEDLIPLSMFGKLVSINGTPTYDLDMIQFNIDVPYSYDFDHTFPVVLTYSTLNVFYTPSTYSELSTMFATYATINSDFAEVVAGTKEASDLDAYVSLQTFDGTEPLYSQLITIIPASTNSVVDIPSSSINDTKYEIFNNSVIIIPKDIDFNNCYLGIHLETSVRGTIQKDMSIKRMELSSFVFNEGSLSQIGTKYSYPVNPFSEVIV